MTILPKAVMRWIKGLGCKLGYHKWIPGMNDGIVKAYRDPSLAKCSNCGLPGYAYKRRKDHNFTLPRQGYIVGYDEMDKEIVLLKILEPPFVNGMAKVQRYTHGGYLPDAEFQLYRLLKWQYNEPFEECRNWEISFAIRALRLGE